MMNWLDELSLKRRAQRSNVFLIETYDYKRLEQLKNQIISGGFSGATKTDFAVLLENDIQRMQTTRYRVDVNIPETERKIGQTQTLDAQGVEAMLKEKSTILIIKQVVLQGHADSIVNELIAWCHDPKLYETRSTIIVFTTNIDLFNEGFRRLVYTIPVPPSTLEERHAILEATVKDINLTSHGKYSPEIPPELPQATAGLNLFDVATAASESWVKYKHLQLDVFTQYKIDILKNFGISYIEPQRGFEAVGGYQLLKDYIANRIVFPLRHPEIASKYGLSTPRGIVLYGFYGCGKSWIVKAFAKEIGYPVLELSSDMLLRGIVGQSEARVQQVTRLLESIAPNIVFMDEFDAVAKDRESVMQTDSGVGRNITNMLLRWLGDSARKSFIVGATNLLEQCDHAFLRTGRIDKIVLVLPPDLTAREQILQVHSNIIRKVPIGKVDFKEIAKNTAMWTGAELERLVMDAASLAMDEKTETVGSNHFDKAMSAIEINSQIRLKRITDMVRVAKQQETIDRQFLYAAVKEFDKGEVQTSSRIAGVLDD